MYEAINRRRFLQQSGSVAAGVAAWGAFQKSRAASAVEGSKSKMKKAVGLAMVQGELTMLEKFKLLKEIGFDSVEVTGGEYTNRDELIDARDKSDLLIHSVVVGTHWKFPLSDPDPKVREKGMAGLKQGLEDAKAFGANGVLLVAGLVTDKIAYDEVYTRSQAEIRKAIPLAEKLGVKILLENVWNNFLLSPLETARYLDEFNSPMVKAYFDVGNCVLYGWPQQWIKILGKRIDKIHIKEFSRKKCHEQGLYKGFDAELLEGDNNWPAVMKALGEIGFAEYSGWATAEIPGGGRERLQQIAQRMDRIFAA